MSSSQSTHERPFPDTEACMAKAPSHQEDGSNENPIQCEDGVVDNLQPGEQPPQRWKCKSTLPSGTVSAKSNFCPSEIIADVFECLAAGTSSYYGISGDRSVRAHQKQVQHTFTVLCRVSKTWYGVALPFLYRSPRVRTRNYFDFTDVVLARSLLDSSLKPAPIGSLIRRLDLSALATDGHGARNAEVVLCLQQGLEVFVAPQRSFGYGCIAALSGCLSLRILDLSVVECSVWLDHLMGQISRLPRLRTFNFPQVVVVQRWVRTQPTAGLSLAQSENPRNQLPWPPKLEHLSLSGVVPESVVRERTLPSTLKSLHFLNCSFNRPDSMHDLILGVGTQLTTLSIGCPMLHLGAPSLDAILTLCPGLNNLFVSTDHISGRFFGELRHPGGGKDGHTGPSGAKLDAKDNEAKKGSKNRIGIQLGHPLTRLELDSSGAGSSTQEPVAPDDVLTAVYDGRLPNLRVVLVSHHLSWTVGNCGQKMRKLAEVLQTRAAVVGEQDLSRVGVWEFGGADDEEGFGSKGLGGAVEDPDGLWDPARLSYRLAFDHV